MNDDVSGDVTEAFVKRLIVGIRATPDRTRSAPAVHSNTVIYTFNLLAIHTFTSRNRNQAGPD